jgi:hypothetical protein
LHYSYEEYKIEVRDAADATVVGLTEMDRVQPLTAFPNPTAGNLRVDFPAAGQLVIVGLDGKIAQSEMVTAGAGRLSLDALATGLYLVELRTEGQVYRTRVSKH